MIAVVDYGAGNLRSVQNTLDAIGVVYRLVNDPEALAGAGKVILPGVGHFGQMMRALDRLRLREPLRCGILEGTPFLGICLGLQALFTRSSEAPEEDGLQIFEGAVERFSGDVRVPHMGWNSLDRAKPSRLLHGLESDPYVYFAHSYYVPVVAEAAAICTYSLPYTAVLECGNAYGVQFHPEKSGPAGQRIVRNFLELS